LFILHPGAEVQVGSPVTAVTGISSPLQPGASQGKTVTTATGGMVVTQLGTGGNITLKSAGVWVIGVPLLIL